MQKVVAVDFDGCLCANAYPEIGKPCWPVINAAKQRRAEGWALILWTSRGGADLTAALAACKAWGLEFDAVNENLPEWRDTFGNDARKIGATEYWDDKAVFMPGLALGDPTVTEAFWFFVHNAHRNMDIPDYFRLAADALHQQISRQKWAGTRFERYARNPYELARMLTDFAAQFGPTPENQPGGCRKACQMATDPAACAVALKADAGYCDNAQRAACLAKWLCGPVADGPAAYDKWHPATETSGTEGDDE